MINIKNKEQDFFSLNKSYSLQKKLQKRKKFCQQLTSLKNHNFSSSFQKNEEKQFHQLLKENLELHKQINNVCFLYVYYNV